MFGIAKKTKKEMYNESVVDLRIHVCGETAIKPYFYLRNGLLHVRYTVDRCVELSSTETAKLKVDMTANPSDKQTVLSKAWNFFAECVGKPVIMDGVAEMEKRIKTYAERNDGHKN